MVRTLLLALAVSLAAQAVTAQTVDWRRAGGDLFVGAPTPAPAAPVLGPDRVVDPAQPYGAEVAAAAAESGLDPKLLHALVVVESRYRPEAVSPAGAGGLTQLMPATAAELGVRDRFDPRENLGGGAAYLARQVRRFGDLRLALAAFNAGPERVARVGAIPQIPETQTYVSAVVDCYLALSAGRPVRSARDCRPGGSIR